MAGMSTMSLAMLVSMLTLQSMTAKSRASADEKTLASWAQNVISDDLTVAEPAMRALREAGPAGLDAVLAAHQDWVGDILAGACPRPPECARLIQAIEHISAQKDGLSSRLYWYTDIEAAKRQAVAQGKPILSLRLLGNLDEEYSCANSRFFRTALYANQQVSDYLRDNFILHWQSVRPVPVITIDFGDGRRLKRTITGNSIHYILDTEGRPVDALPGLYGPAEFLRGLRTAHSIATLFQKFEPARRDSYLVSAHQSALHEIQRQWQVDLITLGRHAEQTSADYAQRVVANKSASAALAAPIALTKAGIEVPMLRAMNFEEMEQTTTDDVWHQLAALHQPQAKLDAGSVMLMHRKHLGAREAARWAISKSMIEDPLVHVVLNFERSIALDTVRNEYLLHRQIHQWFIDGTVPVDLDQLNERVYAELFLTPSSDPWLGLAPRNMYSALPADSERTEPRAPLDH